MAGGTCVAGGHVWWRGVCVTVGESGGGACMAGGHVWQGACMGRCAWQGVCMGGHAWQGGHVW